MRWPPTACRTSGRRPPAPRPRDELAYRRQRQADRGGARLRRTAVRLAEPGPGGAAARARIRGRAAPGAARGRAGADSGRAVDHLRLQSGQHVGRAPGHGPHHQQHLPADGGRVHLYAAAERLVKIAESRRHAQPFRLLRAAVPHHPVAATASHFVEGAGQRWWPYLGAVYIVHAIKRVKGMHIIGPAWNKKTGKAPQAVPATNRNEQQERRTSRA